MARPLDSAQKGGSQPPLASHPGPQMPERMQLKILHPEGTFPRHGKGRDASSEPRQIFWGLKS